MVSAMRVVLIGRTGAGKSHFSKALGAPAESRVGAKRVTTEWDSFLVQVKGQPVTVVDTPGLYDRDSVITAENLKQANAALAADPLTFVVYVFKAGYDGRFEADDQEGLLMVSQAIGKENAQRMVVLINMCAVPEPNVDLLYAELIRDVVALHKNLADVNMLAYMNCSQVSGQENEILRHLLELGKSSVRVEGQITRMEDEQRKKMRAELEAIKKEMREKEAEHLEALGKVRDAAKKVEEEAHLLKKEASARNEQIELLRQESMKHARELRVRDLCQRLETIHTEVKNLISARKKYNVAAVGSAVVAVYAIWPGLITARCQVATLELNEKILRLLKEANALCADTSDVRVLAINNKIQKLGPGGLIHH